MTHDELHGREGREASGDLLPDQPGPGGTGLGVARQEEDCRALCTRLGWDAVAVYPDNDVSAYSGAPRPKWQELPADIHIEINGRAITTAPKIPPAVSDILNHRPPYRVERGAPSTPPLHRVPLLRGTGNRHGGANQTPIHQPYRSVYSVPSLQQNLSVWMKP
ncbi:hypothetical protein ACJ6WE_14060 [Streptomyces sp. MMS24-I31]|uniref:hypothetical protein n=1 Tax=Streptomyces sp. MMS24-I31 TaxID=3351563 RepID=UPI0038968767